jgi:HAD superfamily hydrolase (TIGR01484 family)
MKKILAFDLDGTLAESKSPLDKKMVVLLEQLLFNFEICIISGGKFEQFNKQVITRITDKNNLSKLHLMPTCGTRYYIYNVNDKRWDLVYSEDFKDDEKNLIINALQKASLELGFNKYESWGRTIEDRGSQITFSALGQDAPTEAKYNWDPDGSKKKELRDLVSKYIPQFEVRSGGTTSIDVTKLGIDKAYGMNKLIELLNVTKKEILFFGDALVEGGNDFPVKQFGIDSIQVSDWEDTAKILQAILFVS